MPILIPSDSYKHAFNHKEEGGADEHPVVFLVLKELVSDILSIPGVLKLNMDDALVGPFVRTHDIVVDSDDGDVSSSGSDKVAALFLDSAKEIFGRSFKSV